jgi:hypothetical protein
MKLPEEYRYRFLHRSPDGRVCTLTTLPTGAACTPMFAQEILKAMTREHASQLIDLYIDNFLHMSTDLGDLADDQCALENVCHTCNIQLNKPQEGVREVEYSGMVLSTKREGTLRVNLVRKTVEKLKRFRKQVRSIPTVMTWRDLLAMMGVIMNAAGIMCYSMMTRPLYYALKFLRTKCREFQDKDVNEALRTEVTMWPSVQPYFLQLLDRLIRNDTSTYDLRTPSRRCWMYTDASRWGWGAVLFSPDGIHIFGEQWKKEDVWRRGAEVSINLLELMAVQRAVTHFSPILRDSFVEIYIDNTTALAVVSRFRTRTFSFVHVIERIERTLQKDRIRASCQYVHTSENLADGPSRGRTVQQKQPQL